MSTAYAIIVIIHAALGLSGLAIFWMVALSKKGGRIHRRYGRYYMNVMDCVAGTGLLLAIALYADPIAMKSAALNNPESAERFVAAYRQASLFLGLLAFLLIASIRQAIFSLRVRRGNTGVKRSLNISLLVMLACMATGIGAVGIQSANAVLIGFAGIGLFVGLNGLRFTLKKTASRQQCIYHHVSNTIGTGIAAHTAFFVFGARTWLSEVFLPGWQLVPWLAPSVIGTIVIVFVISRLKTKESEVPM